MYSTYPFSLAELPYSYDALSPVISEDTLHFHHDKHMNAYVDNLNKVLEQHPHFHGFSLEAILTKLNDLPEEIRTAVRNNGGGVYNHQLYFSTLTNQDRASKPSEVFLAAVERDFGGLDKMLDQLKKAAVGRFGSGWAYVVSDKAGMLSICSTSNQDVPDLEKFVPLMTVDVWEHAYYLDYQNRRPDYVSALLSLIDWEVVSRKYQQIAK